jgi:hypothetical protein
VVTKIVELAKAGERHPEILCIDVLADLRSASTRRDITAPPEHAGTASAAASEPD